MPPLLVLDLDQLHFLQLLDPALHLPRLGGLVPEALDELLGLFDLLLLVLVRGELLLFPLRFLLDIEGEVSGVLREHCQD